MADIQQQRLSLASLSTVEQASAELEARLVSIHNDLQLTQTIGLLFVKRQEELKNCFDQLQMLSPGKSSPSQADTLLVVERAVAQCDDSCDSSEPVHASNLQQQQEQMLLPQSLRQQLALLEREFQEGHDGILGLKGMIDAQLVRPDCCQSATVNRLLGFWREISIVAIIVVVLDNTIIRVALDQWEALCQTAKFESVSVTLP